MREHFASIFASNSSQLRAILNFVASAKTGSEQYRLAAHAFSNRRIPECLDLLRRAEELGYDARQCAARRWHCWMFLGRFENAWQECESIDACRTPDPNCLWEGRPFAGDLVIVRCLHGFGDAIQFVRYMDLLKRDAAAITVQTHPQLVSLFRGIASIDHVTRWSDGPGVRGREWDQQIEVMELPRAFGTTLGTIPARVPYIRVAHPYLERSRRALASKDAPRVGILWEGGDWSPNRNVPLEEFLEILDIPDVEFYNFQRGPARDALLSHPLGRRVIDLSGDSPDIGHFAADLSYVDLLITVDTMAAHLAGALARPVWVLLPYEADWRWMLDRSDSPWYPTMRLFRQRSRGNWRWPVRQVSTQLERFIARRDDLALSA